MSDNGTDDQQDDLRDAWIESLLISTHPMESDLNGQRVQRAMDQIELTDDNVAPKRRGVTSVLWGCLAIAASLLLAMFLINGGGGNSGTAIASVKRSLSVTAENTTRKYELRLDQRLANGDSVSIRNELYIRGNDRFAIHHPGPLPRTNFWLGKNEQEEWVVPPIGPVRKGKDMVLSRWLRSHRALDTPYLHIATLLERMSEGYELKPMQDEDLEITDGTLQRCERIRGIRRNGTKPNTPETIDLWASRQSGMAMRVVASWDSQSADQGIRSIEVSYLSEHRELDDTWFTAAAHYRGRRTVLQIDELGQPIRQ